MGVGPSFERGTLNSLYIQLSCTEPSLDEIGSVILEKKISNFVIELSLFRYYLSLK